jgi:hypothetical protein
VVGDDVGAADREVGRRLLRTTTFWLGVPSESVTRIQAGPGVVSLTSTTVLLTIRESIIP